VRRRVVIVPILLLAGVLLARRRRSPRAVPATLAATPRNAPVAPLDPASRFVSVPWTLVASSASEPRLTIRCRADEHMQLDRVDAQETPTQVFVTVLMRRRPPAGGPAASVQDHQAVVELSSPLGTRELVHTPVDVDAPSTPVDQPSASPLYP
jgi:hypothetical protein